MFARIAVLILAIALLVGIVARPSGGGRTAGDVRRQADGHPLVDRGEALRRRPARGDLGAAAPKPPGRHDARAGAAARLALRGFVGRRHALEKLLSLLEVLFADEDLTPASESSSAVCRHAGAAIPASDPVLAQQRTDDVGLCLGTDDCEADAGLHGTSIAVRRPTRSPAAAR